MRRTSKIAAVAVVASHRAHRLRQEERQHHSHEATVPRRLQDRQGQRPQGRSGLRRRRPRRPVLQRLGVRRRLEGRRRSSTATLHRGRGPGRRGRVGSRGPPAPDGRRRLQPDHRCRLRLQRRRQRGRPELPEDQLRGRRRLRPRQEAQQERRRTSTFAANESLLPGRCGGGPEDQDQPGRLRRRRPQRPDQEVRGRLHRRRARRSSPSIKVDVAYIQETDLSGFNDPAGGKTAAAGEFDKGADVVYHAAGASGSGVFDAAVEAGDGKWAIGVDSDQYLTATAAQKPHILTSTLKRVDVASYDCIKSVNDGQRRSRATSPTT